MLLVPRVRLSFTTSLQTEMKHVTGAHHTHHGTASIVPCTSFDPVIINLFLLFVKCEYALKINAQEMSCTGLSGCLTEKDKLIEEEGGEGVYVNILTAWETEDFDNLAFFFEGGGCFFGFRVSSGSLILIPSACMPANIGELLWLKRNHVYEQKYSVSWKGR